MATDAKVKVTLDTKKALEDLRTLIREGETAAGRISGKAQGKGRGAAASDLGKGFGLGAGFALGRKIAGSVGIFSSIGDVVGEAFSGVRADFDAWSTAPLSRARSAARAETVQNFALQAYHSNSTTDAKSYFNTILRAKHIPQQQGASDINKALGGSRGVDPDLKGPLDKLIDAVVTEISDGFTSVLKALFGF